jgi:hypothetical protein
MFAKKQSLELRKVDDEMAKAVKELRDGHKWMIRWILAGLAGLVFSLCSAWAWHMDIGQERIEGQLIILKTEYATRNEVSDLRKLITDLSEKFIRKDQLELIFEVKQRATEKKLDEIINRLDGLEN